MDSSVIHAKALNKYIYTVRFTLTYFFFFFSLPYILSHAFSCSFLYKWNVPNEAFDPSGRMRWSTPMFLTFSTHLLPPSPARDCTWTYTCCPLHTALHMSVLSFFRMEDSFSRSPQKLLLRCFSINSNSFVVSFFKKVSLKRVCPYFKTAWDVI